MRSFITCTWAQILNPSSDKEIQLVYGSTLNGYMTGSLYYGTYHSQRLEDVRFNPLFIEFNVM